MLIELLIRKDFSEIYAIDLSEVMVKKVSKRFAGCASVNVDMCCVSDFVKKNNSVDLIVCITVLQHIVDDVQLQKVLNQLYSTLKPGGLLITIDRISLKMGEQYFYCLPKISFS